MTMQLHLQTVPARNGRLWIRHGFKVFQRQPLALMALLGVSLMFSVLLALLPTVGGLLALMAVPLSTLGFMLATHLVLQKKVPTATVFVAPLRLTRERRNHQLMLAGSFALLAWGVVWLANLVDGEVTRQVMDLMEQNASPDVIGAAASDPRILWGSVLRFGGLAVLSIPYWHAPALVHWGGQGVGQALFSSTLALWRNKGAFALNALLWAALIMAMSGVVSLLLTMMGLLKIAPLVMMACGMVIWTVFYTSLYFTFVDCFMFGAPQNLLDEKQD